MGTEGKYGPITTERGSIPEAEPVFLLRAKDKTTIATLETYLHLCQEAGSPPEHLAGVEQAIQKFKRWQRDHRAQVPTSAGAQFSSS